jgi:fluoroacetyl-CoA thioesterase
MSAELEFVVGESDTAAALGSGDLAVLGTPRLLAWCEAATVAALAADEVGPGHPRTSVGTRMSLDHRSATPVGGRVTVRAEQVQQDGRLRVLAVVATDRHGRTVATGEVRRVVVDRDRFADRLPPA